MSPKSFRGMNGYTERWTCFRCRLSFRIGPKPYRTTETTSCAECKLFHWMITIDKPANVIVGINQIPLAQTVPKA